MALAKTRLALHLVTSAGVQLGSAAPLVRSISDFAGLTLACIRVIDALFLLVR